MTYARLVFSAIAISLGTIAVASLSFAQNSSCLVDVQMTYTSAVEQVIAFRDLTPGDTAIHPEEPKRGDRAQCFVLDGCMVQAELYSASAGTALSGETSDTESQADGVRCTIAKAD